MSSAKLSPPPAGGSEPKTIRVSQIPIARWQTLSVSCAAGMFAWCFAHPFELWKNTVMSAPKGTSQLESLKATAAKGLYTGLSSGIARQVVYTTGRLGCYPIFRDWLLDAEVALGIKADNDPAKATILDRATAGAAAGVFASFLSSPVEVCLVLQTTNKAKERLSLVGAATGIYQGGGLAGFWRGIGPLAFRAGLVGVAQVAVHDQVLTELRKRNTLKPAGSRSGDNFLVNYASVITALFYGIITMPVECARVRISAEAKLPPGVEKRYTGMVQCIGRIIKEEGFMSMYEAFLPYFGRCAIHTVVCFFTIEYLTRGIKAKKAAERGLVLGE